MSHGSLTINLDHLSEALRECTPGQTVTLEVVGQVDHKSESLEFDDSFSLKSIEVKLVSKRGDGTNMEFNRAGKIAMRTMGTLG